MHPKIYLTRAQTRALAIDYPIGDPTGGPAYREMKAPVAAVATMVAASSSAIAAGSLAAMTVFQGIAFVGGALSLVGSLTGNKTLSKIGMVAGIAGGVGALAESAFNVSAGTLGDVFGATGEAAGAAASSTAAPLAASQAPGTLTPVVDGVQTFAIPEPSAITSFPLDSAGGVASTSLAAESASLAAPSINAPAATSLSGTSSVNAPATPLASESLASAPLSSGATNATSATGGASGASGATNAADSSLWGSIKDAGSGVMEFVKKNPEAAKMLSGMGEGAANWLSGKTDAELAAMQSQIGFNDVRAMQIQEQIENEKRRRANLNSGYTQVDQTVRVNPNANIQAPWNTPQPAPQQYTPPPVPQQEIPRQQIPGLIQAAMVPRPA